MEVSVVTPTYNRRQFIPTMIEIYKQQTFPKEKMEWIILDDGQDKVEDLFSGIPNVRYIYMHEKQTIGAKRNYLNKLATAPIIIAMDDDDYYPPERVQNVVDAFYMYPNANLIGSSEMYIYYTDTKKIYAIGPYMPNHATNNTMAWRKRYSDRYQYDESLTKAEEGSFLENYIHPMIQLDARTNLLAICHTDNTIDKQRLRKKHMSSTREAKEKMRLTGLQLKDFVKDRTLYEFYLNL